MYYKDYLGNIYEPAPRGLETPVGNVRRLDEEPSDIVWEPHSVGGGWLQSAPVVSDEFFRPWMDYIDARWSSTPGSKHRYRRSTRSIREVVVPWELPVLHDTDSRTRLVLQLLHADGRTSLVISVYKASDLQLLSEYTLEDGAPVLRRQYEAAYIETSLATEAVFCTVLTELGLPCNRVERLRQAFEENKQEAMRLAREFCDISVFIDRHGVTL